MAQYGLAKSSHLLGDSDGIPPVRSDTVVRKLDHDFNIRLAPRGQASDLGKAAALRDARLEAAGRPGQITQEAKDIEQIGFPDAFGPIRNTRSLNFKSSERKFRQFLRVNRDRIIGNRYRSCLSKRPA